jgi:hypothetical protein
MLSRFAPLYLIDNLRFELHAWVEVSLDPLPKLAQLRLQIWVSAVLLHQEQETFIGYLAKLKGRYSGNAIKYVVKIRRIDILSGRRTDNIVAAADLGRHHRELRPAGAIAVLQRSYIAELIAYEWHCPVGQ